MTQKSRKIVVIGDGMVGKTALLSAFVNDCFNPNYVPTIFETSAKDIQLNDGRRVTLGLWDTAGQEEFDQIRQLAYPGADLILLCYAVDCRTSLENVVDTWIHEIRSYCPSVPLMLVGCKADRRVNKEFQVEASISTLVSLQDVQHVGKVIGAHISIECSAMYNLNVYAVFELAGRFILDLDKSTPKKSSFLRRFRCRSFDHGYPTSDADADKLQFYNSKSTRPVTMISLKRKHSSLKDRLNSPNYLCFIRRHR